MNYVFFTLAGLLLLSACSRQGPREIAIIERVRSNYSNSLADNGIFEILYGYGRSGRRLEKSITNTYYTDKFKFNSVEEARQFFCHFHDEFVKQFNEKKEIRPYLYDFPLGAKNVDLCVYFSRDKETAPDAPYIAAVGNYGDQVFYRTYDPKKKDLVTIHSESYVSAHEIYTANIKKTAKTH